jgi:beta-lactamase regulating signal transducer with metallopeptidase domain
VKRLIKYLILGLTVSVCISVTYTLLLEPLIHKASLIRSDNLEFTTVVSKVENELRMKGLKFESADIYLTEMIDIPSAVGVTYFIPIEIASTKPWIEIKKSYFMNSSDEVREALILHEYGHYLGASHDSNIMKITISPFLSGFDTCPASVMHPSDSMVGCFKNHREYYYLELIDKVLEKK